MSESSSPSSYRPGVCNIGPRERRRRFAAAVACGVWALAHLGAVLAARTLPTALLLGLFVPLSLGVESFLQGRRAFCAGLGLRGRVDPALPGADAPTGDGGRVTDAVARKTDRQYALQLTVLGVVVGGVGTAAVYALALLLG